MAQTRTQIGEVIAGLNVGDSVQVTWSKSGNQSTETGVVWQPPSPAVHLGLGPDLLNPADTELVGIAVTSRAPIQVSQPPIGAVAVFRGLGQNIEVFKRTKKGWLTTGQTTTVPWGLITLAYKSPLQVFQPGTVPAAPVINTLTPGDRRITVAATLGSPGSSAITDVQYKLIFKFEDDLQQEATGWVTSGQTTGNFTILNVENGVAFSVRIRAVNSNGASPESNLLTATPTEA